MRNVPNRFRRPEFQEKLARARGYQRQSSSPRSYKILAVSALVLLLAAAYFLVFAETFLIRDVSLKSEGMKSEKIKRFLLELSAERIYGIPASHFLLLSRARFEKELKDDYPEVRSVTSYKRIFPDGIEVSLETRKSSFIWQSGEDYYFLDEDGVVFQKLINYEPAAYSEILITDRTAESRAVGERLDVKKILKFASDVKEKWPHEVSGLGLVSFSVPTVRSLDAFARTSIGFEVFFDVERSAAAQLKNLAFLLAEEIKPETLNGLSYIDLRLPSIAYYCYKDAPCSPEYQAAGGDINQ